MWLGRQPPIQYANGCPWAVCARSSPHSVNVATPVPVAIASFSRRGVQCRIATSNAEANSGTNTGSAVMCIGGPRQGSVRVRAAPGSACLRPRPLAYFASTRPLVPQRAEIVWIEAAEALVRLDGERQQQTGDGCLDHDVGQHQDLHDRIDRLRDLGDIGEDRGFAVLDVADT